MTEPLPTPPDQPRKRSAIRAVAASVGLSLAMSLLATAIARLLGRRKAEPADGPAAIEAPETPEASAQV